VVRRILLIAFGLSLAFYTIWDRVEARRLSNAIAAIASRGEPTMLNDGLPKPNTPQQSEAASLYAQAAAAALETDESERAGRLDVDRPAAAEWSLDDIRANYPDNAPALQLLDRATPLDFGGFDQEQREGDSFQQSGLEQGLSRLAAMACLRADLASLTGDADAAVRALVPCIRLKRTVVLSQSRASIADRILGSVRVLFRHTTPSDATLADLQHAMDAWPDADATVADVMRDRARFIEMSRTPVYPGVVFVIGHAVFHPFALHNARRELLSFDSAIAAAHGSWRDRWALAIDAQRASIQRFRIHPPSLFEKIEDPYTVLTPLSTYTLTASAKEIAARRLIAGAVAIERFRRAHPAAPPAPVELQEDPFSGKPLVFKSDATGYVIYSLDVNRKDDGGAFYGIGADGPRNFSLQTRDYGIRVPVKQE
jgi:hypothetical protein